MRGQTDARAWPRGRGDHDARRPGSDRPPQRPAAFTLLLYHHYDVPPAGPWRAWHHDPFQLAERESKLYGRGVADGKGPLAAQLSAISALIAAEGELPCGVIFVVEGEGLIGSPNLGSVVAEHHKLLKADAMPGDRRRVRQSRPAALL